jgi:hypothetical protein
MTTSHKDDGGAAFPVHPSAHYCTDLEYMALRGMTLRDYFATAELSKVDRVEICDVPEAYDRLAIHCYRMADAMLKARGEA